jgi:hypothetical protein
MSDKEDSLLDILGYVLGIIILLIFYGGFQYFQMRSGVQETTIELLSENFIPGYNADGISLPLSIAFGGTTPAKVFVNDNVGNTKIVDVEVTQSGIPVLSIFIGSEYYVEISGEELTQLRGF